MNHVPAALALLLIPGVLAASGTRRSWNYAAFCSLKRQPSEKGAPANGHPLRVDPAALAQALASVRFVSESKEAPLFVPAEVETLSKALSEALALAEPGEDLELQSTWKRDASFLSSSMAVTARIFARDGKLNLIVHDTRLDYHNEYNLENRMPRFGFGSRTTQGEAVLKAPGSEARRPDWLVLALEAPAPPAAVPQPAPPAPLKPTPQPLAAPHPPAKPATDPSATVEDRLRALKHFREQDLITEEEYTRQKQELLQEFARTGNGPAAH